MEDPIGLDNHRDMGNKLFPLLVFYKKKIAAPGVFEIDLHRPPFAIREQAAGHVSDVSERDIDLQGVLKQVMDGSQAIGNKRSFFETSGSTIARFALKF